MKRMHRGFARMLCLSLVGLPLACGGTGTHETGGIDAAQGGGGALQVGGTNGSSQAGGNSATSGTISTGGIASAGVGASTTGKGGSTSATRGAASAGANTTGKGGSTSATGGTASAGASTGKGGSTNATGGTASAGASVTGKGGTTSATGGAATGGAGSASGAALSILDPVPGFASVSGGTTGGGTNLAGAVTVKTMSELQNAAKGTTGAIILVEPGDYSGTLSLGSNKTIIGKAPGVKIRGNISISGSGASNVIIRNLAVQGLPCSTYDECRAGADAIYIGNGAHHVWLDHLDVSDGQDGNCDVSQGGDYVTVSWTKFYYTYAKEHRFSNLIAGSDDEPASVGKLRITYMNCWWGDRVDSRQPRGRFGNVHMLNNYHKTGGGQIHGVGKDMALIAENCVYHENRSIWTDMGSPRGWKGIGNEGTASSMNTSNGTVFTIPYQYTAIPASQVVAAVTAAKCGAGNTCTFGP